MSESFVKLFLRGREGRGDYSRRVVGYTVRLRQSLTRLAFISFICVELSFLNIFASQ